MMKPTLPDIKLVSSPRRNFLRAALAVLAGAALTACDRLSNNQAFVDVLKSVEPLNRSVHKLLGRNAMAQEFSEADVAPSFRSNGTLLPTGEQYQQMWANNFADWKLEVGGLVENPLAYSLADLRAMPARTQITRHDCVEGWSAIGKWTGVPLHQILQQVKPLPEARYVVFRCIDSMEKPQADIDSTYYESIDLDDAYHAQTILAYDLNDNALPVSNGAPLRLRVERQLGYKHAKYLMKIELVASFAGIRDGKGGYWEDQGYEWYAGI